MDSRSSIVLFQRAMVHLRRSNEIITHCLADFCFSRTHELQASTTRLVVPATIHRRACPRRISEELPIASMAENRNWSVLCSCALILLALDMLPSTAVEGAPTTLHANTNLAVGYYRYSCPDAEQIISDGMAAAFKRARHTARGVLRLHFHDCFVHVCTPVPT